MFGLYWSTEVKIDKRIIAHRIENSAKASQFVSLAKAIMLGGGRMLDTIDAGCLPEKLANIVRSGVPAGTVDGQDSTATPDAWGSALTEYQSLANAWVESLSTAGAYDKILAVARSFAYLCANRSGWFQLARPDTAPLNLRPRRLPPWS